MKRIIQPILCLLFTLLASHAALSQTYIFDGGSLTVLDDWDLVGDPSTHPSSFIGDNQVFNIRSSVSLNAGWDVQGTDSKVVVGDSSTNIEFTIPENIAFLAEPDNVLIDVSNNATLRITNNTVPKLGALGATSTVIYNENVSGQGNQIIAAGSYGNLTISRASPIKELQGNITVAGNLTFNETEFTVTSATTLTLDGDLTLSGSVTFNANVKTNLDITHTGNSVQTITASGSTGTIPCHDFYSFKTGGSLTLASSPATTLAIGGDFTIDYAGEAAFNDNENTVNVDGTFILSADENKNIPAGTFQNLTVNLSTGNGILQGAATVNGTLTLTSGSIELGSNDLTIGGSISGAGSSNYIITNGGGELVRTSISGTQTYPIGVAGSYNPVTIAVSSGTPTISARVFGDVLTEGTSGTTVAEIEDLVNRTWSVNSASSVDINLTFQWTSGDESGGFEGGDGATARIYKYDTEWQEIEVVSISGNDPSTSTASGIQSLSEFSIGDAGSTLPVTWVSFGGEEVHPGIASLEWKTASELNNKGFEVQKSSDGKNYEMIGFVKGEGTTNETQTYGFADEQLQQNTYYRLKQVDFDGKFDYSRIIFVESSRHIAHPFSVYPNPVEKTASVNLTYELTEPDKKQPLQLQLHDMRGTLLLTANDNIDKLNDVLNAHLARLSQGVYILTLSDSATLTRLKVMKQ